MRIQVLGPVEAWHHDVPVDLGPSRQRGLLGLLALAGGQPLPRAKLIEALWPSEPPASAINMIQSYVKRLRRALEPERVRYQSSAVLPAVGDGYALRVPPGAVDAYVFRDLVSTAGVAQREKQADRAATVLAEAVGLWQGPPLADVPLLADHPKVAALSAERNSALVGYARARGALGEWAQAVPALQEAITAQPLDEGAHAWLIHAYHVLGRRADAFALYHQIRRRLADDLGVDPGAELVAVHAALLRDDDPPATALFTLDAAPEGDAAVEEPVDSSAVLTAYGKSGGSRPPEPRQLPAPPRLFVGREAHLSGLTKALEGDAAPVLAIGGIGGIGKTWLALHWAYQQMDRFSDGQLYADLRGHDRSGQPVAAATVVRGFLDALGVPPDAVPPEAAAQIGLYRSLVVDRRMLIVLDNAADTEHVSSLLPGGTTCTVLVTSRRRLTGLATAHGARMLQLDVLTDDEARRVLKRHLGAERLAAEGDDATELLGYCAGLPLAVGIVAARADTHPDFPLSSLVAELRDHTVRLDALDGHDRAADLRAVLAWSYDALTPAAADVFRLLGATPGPHIGRAAAQALTARPAAETGAALRELENMHLVQQYAPGRYRMHDLVRLYAVDRLGSTPPLDALRRLIDFYLLAALAADHLLDPHRPAIDVPRTGPIPQPDRPADSRAALTWFAAEHANLVIEPIPQPDRPADSRAALTWFAAEHANLVAAQRLAAGHGWHVAVWQLAWAMDTFHWRRGHLEEALAAWQAALAASTQADDPATQILVRRRLGHAYAVAGQHSAALSHLEAALTLAARGADLTSQAHIHHSLAWAWEQQGDNRRALEHAGRALPLYQRIGIPGWEARELNAVGWYHARLGEHRPARARCEAALALFRAHANRTGEANTLDSLGYIEERSGRYGRARDYYRRALTVLRELGHAYQEADTLDHLGHTNTALHDHDEARIAWQAAELLYRAQGRTTDANRVRAQLRP